MEHTPSPQEMPLVCYNAFYNTPAGQAFKKHLGRILLQIWPTLHHLSLLGLGYTAPYIPLWQEQTQPTMTLWPVAEHTPLTFPNLSQHDNFFPSCCISSSENLPFPDSSIDRIFLIHPALSRKSLFHLIKESRRILKENGSMIIALPNRYNILGYMFPFHLEKKWGTFQCDRLFSAASLSIQKQYFVSFSPISRIPEPLYQGLDFIGRNLFPFLSGFILTEVCKTVYNPIPKEAMLFSRRLLTQSLSPQYNNANHYPQNSTEKEWTQT
ncbi:methyltransferase domain-containing protein [Entomobacter blattae]|uniref:Methyltransferase type 11 domain-containing protein n=1 Tax=Entomobacter blattae TaxID=2762277 RepID=A0A7H1NUZ3_9PROT|nr:methyltransferase domain-containing protein [Entomobacter blattae]QNT79603.1 hypothetical protein JGUZn3_24030 [Entomobacter blattae]